jgi:hypothetical protein
MLPRPQDTPVLLLVHHVLPKPGPAETMSVNYGTREGLLLFMGMHILVLRSPPI